MGQALGTVGLVTSPRDVSKGRHAAVLSGSGVRIFWVTDGPFTSLTFSSRLLGWIFVPAAVLPAGSHTCLICHGRIGSHRADSVSGALRELIVTLLKGNQVFSVRH
jgi:hypothetical protein